jgi:poly(A) polymerase
VRRLAEQQHLAYFAGGCVRDFVMGKQPTDYDVATTATPAQIQEIFGPRRTLAIGAAFGVVCVHQKIDGIQHQVEVATFRRDGIYSDGRHPDEVTFSTPEWDAQRRDFTINGLFYDPLRRHIIDYVDGVGDIERRRLRAIGNPEARFREDKLRLLRAIRFAARLDFALDPVTGHSIRQMAEEIVVVSPERIAAELRKMFSHPSRTQAMALMRDTGLLPVLMPELMLIFGTATGEDGLMEHLRRLKQLDLEAALGLFGCLLSPSGKATAETEAREESGSSTVGQGLAGKGPGDGKRWLVSAWQERWRLSNEEANCIGFVLAHGLLLKKADQLAWSRLQPLLISPYIATALSVTAALLEHEFGTDQALSRCRAALAWPRARLNPAPLVDGRLLLELQVPTGPLYASLIKSGRAAQLDGAIRNREEAIGWLRERLNSEV